MALTVGMPVWKISLKRDILKFQYLIFKVFKANQAVSGYRVQKIYVPLNIQHKKRSKCPPISSRPVQFSFHYPCWK